MLINGEDIPVSAEDTLRVGQLQLSGRAYPVELRSVTGGWEAAGSGVRLVPPCWRVLKWIDGRRHSEAFLSLDAAEGRFRYLTGEGVRARAAQNDPR